MSDIKQRLRALHSAKVVVPTIGGQMMGQTIYRLRVTASELEVLHEAADALDARDREIERLEGAWLG